MANKSANLLFPLLRMVKQCLFFLSSPILSWVNFLKKKKKKICFIKDNAKTNLPT